MISVAWPRTTAEPSTPARSLPTWISSLSSTMSTISSTTRPIERLPSENTSSGCAPSRLILTSSLARTSGMSWPRYCTMWRPFESSIFLQSISSSRVTSDSGTALGSGEPARNTSSDIGVLGGGAAARLRCRHARPPPGDRGADLLRHPVGIDDHDHRAVAEDGVAGEHADVAKLARHRLDHDFLGVEHAVDHDAEGLRADMDDDDEAFVRDRLCRRRA